MVTYFNESEALSFTSLIEDKNIAKHESFWFGVISLDDGTSTVWSRQLSNGDEMSFLVQDMTAESDKLSLDAREASPNHMFPFICRCQASKTNRVNRLQNIIPLGFSNLVQLEHVVTSYKAVSHKKSSVMLTKPDAVPLVGGNWE